MRITGQLIEAATETHLWADKFDGTLEDVFELQDKITEQVVGAIAPHIERAEVVRAKRKPTESLDAYDCYLRGREQEFLGSGPENVTRALAFYSKAIELDPDMASAYAHAAGCYNTRKTNGWVENEVLEVAEAKRLADTAIKLGGDDALTLSVCVIVYAFVLRQNHYADTLVKKALSINPNLSTAWRMQAFVDIYLGRHQQAIVSAERSLRLSPRDPAANRAFGLKAWALMHLGHFGEACELASDTLKRYPVWSPMLAILAISHAHAGEIVRAREYAKDYSQRLPLLRLSNIRGYLPVERPQDIEQMVDGLRLAGFPE